MKIKQVVIRGVKHVIIKDPTFSGCIALPIEAGVSPYAMPGNTWTWVGNLEAPTLAPSIKCSQDHFFVQGGMVNFCADAKHANAGKSIPLPDLGDLADFWKDTPAAEQSS